MAKKSKSAPRKRPTSSAGKPILRRLLSGFLRLIEEDLPVTEFNGPGKFDTSVLGTEEYQDVLENLCGGRTPKARKELARALVRPDARAQETWVEIDGRRIGRLKPADARWLARQLSKAELGPCAVKVHALITGGKARKKGPPDPFVVNLCLPPKPEKKPAVPELPEPL